MKALDIILNVLVSATLIVILPILLIGAIAECESIGDALLAATFSITLESLLVMLATAFGVFDNMIDVIRTACKAAKKAFKKLPKRILRGLLRFLYELIDTIKVLTKKPNWKKSGKTWEDYSKEMQYNLDSEHFAKAHNEATDVHTKYRDIALATAYGARLTIPSIRKDAEKTFGKEAVADYAKDLERAESKMAYFRR